MSFAKGTLAATLIFTVACGGKSSVTGPDLVPKAVPVCRNYATVFDTTIFTQSIADSTARTTCAFDRTALRLTCSETTTGPLAGTTMRISSYASLADFVEEAAAVGRARVQRIEITSGNSSATDIYSYDAQKRPTRLEIQMNGGPFVTTIYTDWDGQGRPVAYNGSSASCASSSGAMSYDDAARTVTSTGSGCAGSSILTTTYDSNGNLLQLAFSSRGTTTYSTTSTVTATAAVCL
jgi:hypothetical protein